MKTKDTPFENNQIWFFDDLTGEARINAEEGGANLAKRTTGSH